MKGFFLGVLCTSLAFAGYHYWDANLRVVSTVDQAEPEAAQKPGKKRRRRRKRRVAAHRTGGDLAMSPPPVISAADRAPVAKGDDLSRPEVVRMDLREGPGAGDLRELTQTDIDAKFRARENDILGCISGARPHPEALVPGMVTVKFRIERAGSVKQVRVEAPSILQKGGIYPCIRSVVRELRYPRSDSSQVVTYPFRLG